MLKVILKETLFKRPAVMTSMKIPPLVLGTAMVAMLATFCTSQYTIPPNPKNCFLNFSSPFSWVALVHDTHKPFEGGQRKPGGVAQGAMVTYKAILTAATYFWIQRQEIPSDQLSDTQRYTVIGSRIWDWRNNASNARTNPCTQSKRILHIQYHPQLFTNSATRRILFDYAIITLDGYFNVTPRIFPTTFYPNSPYELILGIQYANVMNTEICAIPIPDPSYLGERDKLVINDRIDFENIKFHSQCIPLICEDESGAALRECAAILQARPNATMLCPKPSWAKTLAFGPGEIDNPYAGTPYICNGSTYGIVTQIKRRSLPTAKYREPKEDFFLVVTFLRVWVWFINKIIENSPTNKPLFLETASLRKETFTKPYKPAPAVTPVNPQAKIAAFRFPRGKNASPEGISAGIGSMAVMNAIFAASCTAFL